MIIPSARAIESIRGGRVGVCVDHPAPHTDRWLVVKLPTPLLRAIRAGAPTAMLAWSVEVDGGVVAVIGLRIVDDLGAPATVLGACRSQLDTDDLLRLLASAVIPVQFLNELLLPVAWGTAPNPSTRGGAVVAALEAGTPRPGCEPSAVNRNRALDIVERTLPPGAPHEGAIRARCELALIFSRIDAPQISFPGSGAVCLDDDDVGTELERLAFQAFEHLCPFGAFHQPQVESGGRLRELCDVLAVSRVREFDDEGLFVVQCKAAAETAAGLSRPTSRRAASAQRSLVRAIAQLRGAVRLLRAGVAVRRADGTSVEEDPPGFTPPAFLEPIDLRRSAAAVGHAIALVSDMHDRLDWRAIAHALVDGSRRSGFLFHVLDLAELRTLVSHSRGRAAVFEAHLVQRWEAMRAGGTALVRQQAAPT